MILTDKQFKDKVKKDNAKAIYFYEGHVSDVTGMRPFETMNCQSNVECLNALVKFSESFPHKFTCYIHSSRQSITVKGLCMRIDLSIREHIETTVNALPTAPTAPAMDRETMKAEIIAEVTKDNQHHKTVKELEIANLQLAKQTIVSEKIAMVFYQLIQKMSGGMEFAGAMQGETATAQDTNQETTQEQSETIETAMLFLQKQLGNEFLIKLAGKIKADPSLSNQLKSML